MVCNYRVHRRGIAYNLDSNRMANPSPGLEAPSDFAQTDSIETAAICYQV